MSRPKMTDAHRQRIRGQIMDRAYEILIEKGPESISSRAIAQHLDLTHMGLFTYFPNQAAILQALAEREQQKLLEKLQPYKQRAQHEDIALVLKGMLVQFQQFAREKPNLYQLIWIEPEVNIPPHWMQPTIDLVAGLIRIGVDKSVFDVNDAQRASILVLSLVNMPFMLSACGKISRDESLDQLSQEALETAMNYLLAKKASGVPARPETSKIQPAWVRQTASTVRRFINRLLKH